MAADERKGTRSVDTVLEQVRIERASQLDHFDALDSKAGIVLGFAGALVALATGQHGIAWLGRCVAAGSGLVALWTFSPRRYESTDVYALRRKYLGAEPAFAKLVLLDSQVSMIQTTKRVLERKARRLKFAMGLLAVAVALTAAAVPIH